MSVLKNLEAKIAGAVEGTFSRVFRSEVRPIEIARRLAREMEDHCSQSLSHLYVPNEYRVFLSSEDRRRFRDYESVLATELSSYLLEHARREGFTLAAPPVIEFETDPRLGLGRFGIHTETAVPHPPQRSSPPAPEPELASRTMVSSGAARLAAPLAEPHPGARAQASLIWEGRRVAIGDGGATIGRSRRCEIVLDDPNVSRRHAQISPRGDGWVLNDLGSTNGTKLNGTRIDAPEVLRSGDQIAIGDASIRFDVA